MVKKHNNYDNTLVGAYIRQIENPDSIGWDATTRTWIASDGKEYDPNNRGMGVDVLYNNAANTLTEGREGRYLTEQEERDLRNQHIKYSLGVVDRHKRNIPGLENMSPRKEAEAVGLIYRGDGPKLKDASTPLGKAYRSSNEENFHRAVSDYYRSQGLNTRADNDNLFWKEKTKISYNPSRQRHVEQSDATRVVKPQPIFTPRGDVKKAMQDKVDYHNLMNSISIQNNPQPVYNPPMKYDKGGKISDSQYYSIMEKVAEDNYRKWGFNTPDEALTHALNDNTYNYRGFYNKYPYSEANADTHWTDEFKTVWHPTFSDESIYSGNKSQFNPQGIQGGHWFGDTFIPSVSQINEQNKYEEGGDLTSPKLWNDLSMAEKAEMMKVAVQNGITTLPEIREKYNEFAKGGYIPSDRIKDRITHYEGKAITGAIDPLSGKYGKNNSFESEAKGFYNALPEDIRDQVLSNPELADSLYSYSYNVGAGNFKKRVVPTLRRYYQGKATVSDIERSMWASGDSRLRGLQRRRAEERAGVRSALTDSNSIYPTMSSYSENLPFTPFYNKAFNTPLSSYDVPTVTLPIEEPLVQAAEDYAYSKEALDRQERQNRLNAFNMLLSMSNPNSTNNSLMDTIGMLTGRNFAHGGNLFDGTSQNSQQLANPYKPNGGFYYINSEGQVVNPTSKDTIELPEAAVKKYSLQELKALQYKQHLEQLEPIIYKKQD